jgi:glycosyltransferase involved in cell wall biosynthesis
MISHPRLLFVTPHAFNHVTGGGVAFTNLFRGWPADRLATVHNDLQPVSEDVCRHYFALGEEEIGLAEPFAKLRRVLRRPRRGPSSSPAQSLGSGFRKPAGLRRLALAALGNALPERAVLTPRLERWISDFRPDILYTILGSNGMMALINSIADRFDLPLVVHIMDDWPAVAYRRGALAPFQRRTMDQQLARLLNRAAECLAISPAMAVAYERRYGRPFRDFQNTIDVARWRPMNKRDRAKNDPAELLYVGSIFADAQLDALADCAKAVATLAGQGFPIRLLISSPADQVERFRARLAIGQAIAIEPVIADDAAFFARIAAADALLVPSNFDRDSVRFIRYSMPAKLPAYMVSGTPILVYGSGETAQVQYALEAGWGHVVLRRDPAALVQGIRLIVEDDDLRRCVRDAALATVALRHDAAAVRPAFQSVLAGAARVRETVPVG